MRQYSINLVTLSFCISCHLLACPQYKAFDPSVSVAEKIAIAGLLDDPRLGDSRFQPIRDLLLDPNLSTESLAMLQISLQFRGNGPQPANSFKLLSQLPTNPATKLPENINRFIQDGSASSEEWDWLQSLADHARNAGGSSEVEFARYQQYIAGLREHSAWRIREVEERRLGGTGVDEFLGDFFK
jgi:hypothetical protein